MAYWVNLPPVYPWDTNPLNIVSNFSEVDREIIANLKEALQAETYRISFSASIVII